MRRDGLGESGRTVKRIISMAICGLALAAAQAQLRIVNYNVAQLNGNGPALQRVFSALNADDKPGFATAPHLYVFQEVQSGDVGPLLTRLNAAAPPGVLYATGTYTNNNENGTAGAQAMFYRSDTLTEDAAAHTDIFTGAGRYADRWRLTLNGYDSPEASFYIYSAHLKASTGATNEQQRLFGATAIRADADALPAGSHIIFAGDYNVYSNGELAYQHLISAGPAQAIDPLGSGGWGGAGQAIKHTQSPQDNGPLVGGGMDDRFDLQLSTAALHDGEGLALIAGVYRSLGNDGNHYNLAINNGANSYYPDDIPRSNALADDLFDASDHVPVVAEYQLPAVLSATLPADLGRAIQGAAVDVELLVRNAAAVVEASGLGADELDYQVSAAGALSGTAAGSALATIPPTDDSVLLALDTSALGPAPASVDVTSDSEAAQGAATHLTTTATIVRPAVPSLDNATQQSSRDVFRLVLAHGGPAPLSVDVFNFGFDAEQATLDIDAVAGLTPPLEFVSGLQSGVGAAPGTLSFSFDPSGLATQDMTRSITIEVSDEDIPGEAATSLAVDVHLLVRELPGDVDGDCDIDLTDLSLTLASFGVCEPQPGYEPAADLDGSGCVELSDLSVQLAGYGATCP